MCRRCGVPDGTAVGVGSGVVGGGELMRMRGGIVCCGRVRIKDFFAVWFCSLVITLCAVKVTDVIIFQSLHVFTFFVRNVVRKL
jgi:hypothetical protein